MFLCSSEGKYVFWCVVFSRRRKNEHTKTRTEERRSLQEALCSYGRKYVSV